MEVISQTTDDLRDFLKEYEQYISPNGHLSIYLMHLFQEYCALKNAFPTVDFSTTARIKSPQSAYDKRSKGKINICDIYANKYIIYNVDGATSENALVAACYQFSDFLEKFNLSCGAKIITRKDYIKEPKPSSYKSLHVTYECFYMSEHSETFSNALEKHSQKKSFKCESQIKTYQMRWNEKYGPANHKTTYKDRSEVFLDTVPIYIGRIGDSEYFEVKDKEYSFREFYGFSFKEYFGISYADFLKGKKAIKPYFVSG